MGIYYLYNSYMNIQFIRYAVWFECHEDTYLVRTILFDPGRSQGEISLRQNNLRTYPYSSAKVVGSPLYNGVQNCGKGKSAEEEAVDGMESADST